MPLRMGMVVQDESVWLQVVHFLRTLTLTPSCPMMMAPLPAVALPCRAECQAETGAGLLGARAGGAASAAVSGGAGSGAGGACVWMAGATAAGSGGTATGRSSGGWA